MQLWHGQAMPHVDIPSLSQLAKTPEAALKGIGKVVADMAEQGLNLNRLACAKLAA